MTNIEKPMVIQTLCEVFGGQLAGRHFLFENGLLKKDPGSKNWEVAIPERFFLVSIVYLQNKKWETTTGSYDDGFIAFKKSNISISIFCEEEGRKITVADIIEYKRRNSLMRLGKETKRHRKDLFEFISLLNG